MSVIPCCHASLIRNCPGSRAFCLALAILATILLSATGIAQTDGSLEKKKEEGPMIRVLCIQTLTENEEQAVLATKTEDDKWIEHGSITLRTPFISEWLRVSPGMTHLARKEGGEIKSFGSFFIPPNGKRLVVILVPDKKNNIYRTQTVDPGSLGFSRGKALVLNYGQVPALVKLGRKQISVPVGKQIVMDVDGNEDGMYRLLVGHQDKDGKIIPCYDKFVSSKANTRKFILLFPKSGSGLRAMTISEFGPFD